MPGDPCLVDRVCNQQGEKIVSKRTEVAIIVGGSVVLVWAIVCILAVGSVLIKVAGGMS